MSRKNSIENVVPIPNTAINPGPGSPKWGVVATVKAPLVEIAGFAAYHLSLGAARIYLYLDDPQKGDIAFLKTNNKIDVISCDASWWAQHRQPRNDAHQRRQMFNATHAYRRTDVDWLAHIDVDEFILPSQPIANTLATVPDTDAILQMPSAELLAPTIPDDPARFFKLTPRQANHPSTIREAIYPTYGRHLRGGFISHIDGKIFVRRGLKNVTVGIHSLLFQNLPITNCYAQQALRIGHAHAPSWEAFQKHLDFRLSQGSYRKRDNTDFRLADIIQYLRENEGETGLRHLFKEVNEATPTLVVALRHHNMLIEHPLDLNNKIVDIFGEIPPLETDDSGQ